MTPAQNLKVFTKPYIFTIRRAGTSANGNVSYTGFGFKPNYIIMNYGVVGGSASMGRIFWGNSSNRGGYYHTTTDEIAKPSSNINITDPSSNVIQGSLVSLDNDGFTISWTKTNNPTFTLLAYIVAFP